MWSLGNPNLRGRQPFGDYGGDRLGVTPLVDTSAFEFPINRSMVETISGARQIGALQGEWRSALSSCSAPHIFQEPEWLSLWLEHRAGAKDQPITLAVRERGRLACLAPLVRSRSRHLRLLPCRRLDVMGSDEPVHDNFLYLGDAEASLGKLLGSLAARSDWDILTLNTRAEKVAPAVLKKLCDDHGLLLVDSSVSASPYLELAPTWEEFYGRCLKPRFRSWLRNRETKLAPFGPLNHEVHTTPATVEQAMDRVLALSLRGWAHEEGTAIGSTPQLCAFYRSVARLAAEKGWLYLHILTANGRDVAFEFNMLYGNVVYNLKLAFDPELGVGSPGQVLKRYVLEDAIGRGAVGYDMLGVADDYKMKWTDVTRKRYKWVIFNRRPYARFLHAMQTHVWSPLRKFHEDHRHHHSPVGQELPGDA